jgi:hypothetical protein
MSFESKRHVCLRLSRSHRSTRGEGISSLRIAFLANVLSRSQPSLFSRTLTPLVKRTAQDTPATSTSLLTIQKNFYVDFSCGSITFGSMSINARHPDGRQGQKSAQTNIPGTSSLLEPAQDLWTCMECGSENANWCTDCPVCGGQKRCDIAETNNRS